MATPKKMKSGNWRVRVYDFTDDKGKAHYKSITCEKKSDAEYYASLYKKNRKTQTTSSQSLYDVIDKYISLSSTLSPTTLQTYKSMQKFAFQDIMQKPICDITNEVMQNAINTECQRCHKGKQLSAKTIKNEWGLICSALHSVNISFNVKLPKYQKRVKDYPNPSDVISAIKGTSIELPCLLAMWLSFSMSEIRGLMYSDIKDGYITINRVMVDIGGVPTVKDNAKVETRLRRHKIPAYINFLIENDKRYQEYKRTSENGFLVPYNHSQIYGRFKRIMHQNNLSITFHDLRHINASVMMMLNIPEKYALERGGWKTPHVMKSVYQHTFSDERKIVDSTIDTYFNSLLSPAPSCTDVKDSEHV